MSYQHDQHVPTVIADAPDEPQPGDYLAPPRLIPGDNLSTARSIALVLLIGTAFIQGEKTMREILHLLPIGSAAWLFKVAVGVGALVLQGIAIFGSRRWPTFALWLALAAVLVGFYIPFSR